MTTFPKILTLPALLLAACASGPQTGASTSQTAEPPPSNATADATQQGSLDLNPDAYIRGELSLSLVLNDGLRPTGSAKGPGHHFHQISCVSGASVMSPIYTDYEIEGEPARDIATVDCRLMSADTWCVRAQITPEGGEAVAFDWVCQHVDERVRFGDEVREVGSLEVGVLDVVLGSE